MKATEEPNDKLSFERAVVGLVLAGLATSPLVAALAAFGGVVAVLIWAGSAVALAWPIARWAPRKLDRAARRRPIVAALWALLAIVAIGQAARVGLFMADGSKAQHSAIFGDRFAARHSCLAAYVGAAKRAAERTGAVYERTSEAENREFLPFSPDDDKYQYPPQFLLLADVMGRVFPTFAGVRSAWYVLVGGTFALGLLALFRWLGDDEAMVSGLLIPAVWVSFSDAHHLSNWEHPSPGRGHLHHGDDRVLEGAQRLGGRSPLRRNRRQTISELAAARAPHEEALSRGGLEHRVHCVLVRAGNLVIRMATAHRRIIGSMSGQR